jgi:ribosome-binding factor A
MNDLIQRKLGTLILKEVQDPRLKMVTISSVDVSKDMSFAKVYFSILGTDHTVEDALLALKKASGFLRHQLAQTLDCRIVPALSFMHDTSFERSDHMNRLIQKAVGSSSSSSEEAAPQEEDDSA